YDRDPPSGPALAHAVPPFIGSIRPTMARSFRGRKPAGAAASAPPSIPRSAAHVTRCPDASRPSAGGSLPKRRPHAATHRPVSEIAHFVRFPGPIAIARTSPETSDLSAACLTHAGQTRDLGATCARGAPDPRRERRPAARPRLAT